MDQHILDTLPVVWIFIVIRQSSCREFLVHSFVVSALCHPVVTTGNRPAMSVVSSVRQELNFEVRFGLLHTFESYFSNSILLRKTFVRRSCTFISKLAGFFPECVAKGSRL